MNTMKRRPLKRQLLRLDNLETREAGDYDEDGSGGPTAGSVYQVVASKPWRANLVSSKLADGRHAPAIDLDVPAKLVPSRTEGHTHLYIDVPMSWRKYRMLLWVMQHVGIVEPGYYRASVKRRQSALRYSCYGQQRPDPKVAAMLRAADALARELAEAATPPVNPWGGR